jgi:uncharacterized protein YjbI with pentapeptide repeats
MDENHQDKAESELIATEVRRSIPSLIPKDQEKLDYLQKKQGKERNKWTGFSGKTLWDWLSLLLQLLGVIAIPLAIALGTTYFSTQQNQTSTQIATSQQQEACLQTYLDRMSDLLLNHNLRKSQPGDEVSQVAREQTLTTLRRLDGYHNNILLQFLQDAHLIDMKNAVIDLHTANLSNADLSTANLSGANLSGANLSTANLSGANLSNASLNGANLGNAALSGADLSTADLSSAILSDADLSNADLSNANLSGVGLSNANLSNANLSNADLSGAIVTQGQLNTVASLHGATMPDGSKHP